MLRIFNVHVQFLCRLDFQKRRKPGGLQQLNFPTADTQMVPRSTYGVVFLVLVIDALQFSLKVPSTMILRAKTISSTQNIESALKSYWSAKKSVYSESGYKLKFDMFEREASELERSVDANEGIGSDGKQSRVGDFGKRNNEEKEEERVNTDGENVRGRYGNLRALEAQNSGARGNWIQADGNYILRPSIDIDNPPIGVIHFLGGAFVGAIPHLAYKNLLESFSDAGYVVVATPYRLEFDYAKTCDSILDKFDRVAVELANQYGPLPVVGMGHSCGALLQSLITSLFPDAPRAANVLISYNNKPAKEAIPAFEELIVPLSSFYSNNYKNAVSFLHHRGLSLNDVLTTIEESINEFISSSPLVPSFVEYDLIPVLRESVEIVDQVPDILKMIGDGELEFVPSPGDTKEVCRRMYRARSTLLLKFENDSIDESEEIEKVLREANTIMRMKRPMIEMDVELKCLGGTHLTPLTQNLFIDVPAELSIPDILVKNQLRDLVEENLLLNVHDVKKEILNWLDIRLGR